MLTRCPPDEMRKLETLFRGMKHDLAVESILSGNTASPVWVDDVYDPKVGVTWSGSRIYVAGEVTDDMFSDLVEIIKRNQDVRGIGLSLVYLEPGSDDPRFMKLEGFNVHPRSRNYYEIDATTHDWRAEPPQGYTFRMIDRSLLSQGLVNTDRVIDEMKSERSTVEEFLEKSFGFCAVAGGEMAGWCMSEYNTGDRFEIGIEVVEHHRRRGLALQIAKTTISHGVSLGYRLVGWHCWVDNLASNRLAQALGFSHVCEYPVYVLRRAASTN